jgi:lysylphosphatidylglycerol synthetase-like protein (DUF2156 family)
LTERIRHANNGTDTTRVAAMPNVSAHQPMIIPIPSSAKWTARLLFVLIALCIGPTAGLTAFASKMSWMELLALGAGTVLVLGGCIFWSNYHFKRLVIWAELGDDFHFQTKLVERRVPWSDVARFVLSEPGSPIWRLSIINVLLTDGTKLAIWAKTPQAEAALELVRSKPWARVWPGRPLESGVAVVALILGIIASSTGLIAGYWLLEYYAGQVPFPWGFPFDVRVQIMAVIGGPLLGVGGIGFGLYHLIRRPIFYRGGVLRSRNVEPNGIWHAMKTLFSRSE